MINTAEKLAPLLPRLQTANWIAVDTEADSLHAYPEKLCLIQLSFGATDALLDPLASLDLTPVLNILQRHELIFHGADYDLRLLRKTFGFVPGAVFDTMLAGLLLGAKQVGLASLVQRHLGVTLEKGPQKADWGRRPLTERMEQYARNDTRYLKPLSDLLRAELQAKGRLDWHREMCTRLIQDCSVVAEPDVDRIWRVKGSHALGPDALAVLREIWRWREHEAIGSNRPPFFILSPATMVALAVNAVQALPYERFLPRRFSPRRQAGLRRAIEHGLEAKHKPEVLRPRSHRLTEAQSRRYRELERRRNRRAVEHKIDPALIASRATLLSLCRDGGTAEETLMNWQREMLLG